jgi:hypothetical protein
MRRLSLEDNPIANVPQILRRHWRNCKGPLKWFLAGMAAALIGVLTCVPTRK